METYEKPLAERDRDAQMVLTLAEDTLANAHRHDRGLTLGETEYLLGLVREALPARKQVAS